MFGAILKGLGSGVKAVAAGNAQANLGLQSPHLPAALVRVGRFLYSAAGLWIGISWYSGYANARSDTGSGPRLVIGGKARNSVDRPDKSFSAPTVQEVPGGATGGVSGSLPGGAKAGGFLPRNAPYKPGRQDQGRDGSTTPGGPMIAPGDGRVIRIGVDNGGFGPDYPIVAFTSGPYRGRILYLGHTHSALRAGASFRKDEILSYTGKTPVGNATVPGWFEVGFADSGSPGPLGQPAPFN